MYSANILVLERHEECPTAVDSSTEEHIRTLTNISSTNNINDNDNDNDNDDDNDDDDKFLPFDEEEEEQMKIEPILPLKSQRYDTELKHIVFGIAGSSNLWSKRKEYIKLWWRPKETRGAVWLDKKVYTKRNEGLPPIRISGDTSKFKYHNRQGQRSALRISRVVSETLRLGMKDVRWLVMGDDDTVFMVENVMRVLSKYDHRQFYYIGSSSESHVQNIYFSYAMAYGGGGFAISYPLAQELEKMQDQCIQRYDRSLKIVVHLRSYLSRYILELVGTLDCMGVMIEFKLVWPSSEYRSQENLGFIRFYEYYYCQLISYKFFLFKISLKKKRISLRT